MDHRHSVCRQPRVAVVNGEWGRRFSWRHGAENLPGGGVQAGMCGKMKNVRTRRDLSVNNRTSERKMPAKCNRNAHCAHI